MAPRARNRSGTPIRGIALVHSDIVADVDLYRVIRRDADYNGARLTGTNERLPTHKRLVKPGDTDALREQVRRAASTQSQAVKRLAGG